MFVRVSHARTPSRRHGAPRPRCGPQRPALGGIRRLSALDTVRARIALAVDLGLLAPGERLPPTDQIAAALGVSEITARRALVSLCADGVLERRRGRSGGTLVAERPVKGEGHRDRGLPRPPPPRSTG